jgi:hypothetical protein
LLLVPLSIAIVIYMAALAAAVLYDSQQDWRRHTRSVFARAGAATQMQARIDQDAAALQESPLWSRFYISPTSGIGAVQLQSDVGSLLSRTQSSTQSLAPIASLPMQGFTRIGVRLSASMRIDQLQSFLATAAVHPRYLRIEQLSVIAPQGQAPAENSPLAVSMEVYGFELKERPR